MNAPVILVKMAQHVLTEMNPTLALVRRDGQECIVKIVSVYIIIIKIMIIIM